MRTEPTDEHGFIEPSQVKTKTGRRNATNPVEYHVKFDVYREAPGGKRTKRGTVELVGDSLRYTKSRHRKPEFTKRLSTIIDMLEEL